MKYHLLGMQDPEAELRIQRGLQDKLDAMLRRDLYSRSKQAPTAEERERARQAYLEAVGMAPDFRWQTPPDIPADN